MVNKKLNKPFWLVTGIITAFLFSSDRNINLSGSELPKRRKTKRLFYMQNNKTVPQDQINEGKKMARSGHGCLHAVWAYNADEARELIRQGQAESICNLNLGYDKPVSKRFQKSQKNAFTYYPIYENSDLDNLATTIQNLESAKLKKLHSYLKNQGIELELANRQQLTAQLANITRNKNIAEEIQYIVTESSSAIDKYAEKPTYEMTSHEFYDTNTRFKGLHSILGKLADKIMDIEHKGRQRRFDTVLQHPDKENYNLVNEYNNHMKFLQGEIRKIELTNHKNIVKKAIQQGYQVPAKVLTEYPDLKKKIMPEQVSFTEPSQMTLFGSIIDPDQPYMKSSPISAVLQRRFEYTTFSPYDLNKEFNESVEAKEKETIDKLKVFRLTEIPEDVQKALAYYRKAVYEFLVTKANQVPGPMVTGPSKYNYQKLEKSLKREDKALKSVDTAKEYLRKAINRNITGKKTITQQQSHDNWLQEALITPKREFADKVFQATYDKANPNLQADYDEGVFVTAVKNKGKKLHAQLIDEAIQQGLEINESVKKDYPEKFGLEKTKPDIKKQVKQKQKAIEEFIRHQEESQRVSDEWEAPARQRIKEFKERQRQRELENQVVKKNMPEQTSFSEPSQMMLFGRLNYL